MKVKIFDYTDGSETPVLSEGGECDLRECFPDDDEEYQAALDALKAEGRYWTGGGAAPLVLLMKG